MRLATRSFASAAAARTTVYGCGSNVMDLFFPTRKLPMPGEKQYFAAETCMTDAVVGGVTLNHLSWARALGAPTGLLALQGEDANGKTIRAKMEELGVSAEFVRVSPAYSTSVSHILLEPSGERTILMAPASTSRMSAGTVEAEFGPAVRTRAALLTTEISQVPLSGVEHLLRTAAASGVPSLLDVDVTPTTATGPAQLGTLEQVRACVTQATCLKLTASAAEELLRLVAPGAQLEGSLERVAQQLADAFGVHLCVVTDGSRGSALAVGRRYTPPPSLAGRFPPLPPSRVDAVTVPIYGGVTQVDATGAGDAFFGGVIASAYTWGFPTTPDALVRMGSVAAAAGAACVEVLGALPVRAVSSSRVHALYPPAADLIAASRALDEAAGLGRSSGSSTHAGAGSGGGSSRSTRRVEAFLSSLHLDGDAVQATARAHSRSCTQTDGPALHVALATAVGFLAAAAAGQPAGRGVSHVHCTGLGKSGAVAARFAISLRSVGVRASFTHAAEWAHGDLGCVQAGDTVCALSHSGRPGELLDVAARVRALGAHVLSVTHDGSSPLALVSDAHFAAPVPTLSGAEGGGSSTELLGQVPTRSIVAQEAVCNALLSALVAETGLTREGFKANHPGGAIGAAEPMTAGYASLDCTLSAPR